MNRTLIIAAAVAGALVSASAAAQPPIDSDMKVAYSHRCDDGYAALELSAEQRAKLADIEREFQARQSQAVDRMHGQEVDMHDLFGPGAVDEATARKGYQAMADAHKEMFEAQLEARKRVDGVLTPEQREQLRRR